MIKNVKELTNGFNGEFLFVYSTPTNSFFVYKDDDTDKIFLVTVDTYFEVKAMVEIEDADILFDNERIFWFRPKREKSTLNFTGKVTKGGKIHHFKFNETGESVEVQEYSSDSKEIPSNYGLLSCMDGIEVIYAIQLWGVLCFTGNYIDSEGYSTPVYGEVDLEKDQLYKVYHMYSDVGEIVPRAISIDTRDNKVYLVGKLTSEDEKESTPFMDTLLYSKPPL